MQSRRDKRQRQRQQSFSSCSHAPDLPVDCEFVCLHCVLHTIHDGRRYTCRNFVLLYEHAKKREMAAGSHCDLLISPLK